MSHRNNGKKLRRSYLYLYLFTFAISGCAGVSNYQDDDVGGAVRENIALQTVNKEGIPALPDAPAGLSGTAQKAVIDRYLWSYVQPAPQSSAVSMSFGGGGAPAQPAMPQQGVTLP